MGGSLWWSVWTYFIPFLAILLLLEKRHKNPENKNDAKLFLGLFLAVFMKHLLFGFEFVTTILLAIYPPIIYYFWIEKKSFSSFIIFSIKSGFIALLAVFTQSIILFYQLSVLKGGGILDGLYHILFLYKKRGSFESYGDITFYDIISKVFDNFFKTNPFNPDLFTINNIFNFLTFFLFTALVAYLIYNFLIEKTFTQEKRKLTGLFIATAFSVLCPLSWYVMFIEHAYIHFHRDVIVWYVPTMLYCFVIIGIAISLIFNRLISHKYIK